jgi:UDP-3-O-[3-hydroxymyristoyl] glucosamine N-acyltransferase
MSGVTKDITKPGAYMGFPAAEVSRTKRQMVDVRGIPKLKQRLKQLEELWEND